MAHLLPNVMRHSDFLSAGNVTWFSLVSAALWWTNAYTNHFTEERFFQFNVCHTQNLTCDDKLTINCC